MKKIIVGALIILVVIGAFAIIENGGFTSNKLSYIADVKEEKNTNVNTKQKEYVVLANDRILEVEKEAVKCFQVSSSYKEETLWEETSYIKYPICVKRDNLVCVFDKQGYSGIVYGSEGKKYEFKAKLPILEVAINKNGYLAVLQKSSTQEQSKSVITIYNDKGEQMIDRVSYQENGGVPIAVAIADDGETFASVYLDVSSNNIQSKVIFFKIDGKELKDNLFSSFKYQDTIITQLKYMDNENIIAVGDNKIIRINLFTEKSSETLIEDRIIDANLNFDDMIVLTCVRSINQLSKEANYIMFYNTSLKKKKEQVVYNNISQVSNNKNKIVVGNGSDYYIYTKRGISKCKNSFNVDVKQLLPFNKSNSMLVATNKGLQLYRMQSAALMMSD